MVFDMGDLAHPFQVCRFYTHTLLTFVMSVVLRPRRRAVFKSADVAMQ